jgi:hypothetical protein
MKVIFNYATRQFESIEPTMRERFMLGGRVDFSKGGFAELTKLLNLLPDGTEVTRDMVQKLIDDNNLDVTVRNYFARPSKDLKEGITLVKQKSRIKITPEMLKKFDDYVKDTKLTLKDIGAKPEFGYDPKKNQLSSDSLLYKEYVKAYGEPEPGRFKEFRLTADKGFGKKILTAYDDQIKNFGKSNIVQIVKDVYGPGVKDFDGTRRTVRRFLETERGYKGKANIPVGDENLSKDDIRSRERKKKLKPITDTGIEKFMAAPEGSGLQFHHSDATKTSLVTLRNVVYVPSDVNNYIQKYEGPITQRKKEIEKLIKNKPDGYKKQIDTKLKQIRNSITKANIDLDKAGYSAFKDIIEVDIVDPFGKKIKIGGNTALKIGSDLIQEIGLDPDKPLKQYTSEERIKLAKAKDALLDVSKRNIPDLSKVKPELDLKPISGKSNIKAKITEFRNTAQNVVNKIPFKGLRIVPGAAAAAIDYGVFAGLLGTPIDEAIVGASGWLTKRPELGKALGTHAMAYSEGKMNFAELREKSLPILNEIRKEQFELPESKLPPVAEEINEKMGEGTIKIADEVPQPESAERRKMFEDFNERFGDTNELEISDIDNPFMAAMGGRVGFANGSPDPMEEMATLKQALAAVRSSKVTDQFLYDTSPVGKLEKNILGKDGDRNLMQSFNTQFLDPRTYPYYAQRLLRGAANIPEFILSTPKAGLAFIKDLKQNAGITKEGVEEILEILDPSITRDILNGQFGDLLGISDKAIQASEEKRTGPQRTTGEFLQVAGELPGPATPIFLLGYAPKLLRQLRDLGASGTAIDKINKEIENKVAQQGVDQTRRDIVLSIGAGGAVAFLKYLGLDTLFKAAPKAVKAAPKIVTKGGTPKYFFDFVSLIKSKGKDITDKAATLERQKVYDYNGYELTEDISTGKISIRKDTEGGGSYYIGDGEYETVDGIIRKEEIVYDPPETILDDAGKPKEVPDNYEENTLLPDADGDVGDVSAGLNSIDEILELLSKDGKKYSLKELGEMGINPEGLGEDLLKQILRNPEEIKLLDAKEMFKDTMNKVKYKIEKAGGGRVDFDKGGPTGLATLGALKPDKDDDLRSDPVGIIMEGKPKSSRFDNVFLDTIEEIKEKANEPIKYTDGTTYYPEYNVFVDEEFNEVPGPSKGAIPLKEQREIDLVKPRERLEAAGGGILKMAGDDSGPPPKSGPTPHGLPYVAKNVRPIKERK